MCGPLLVTWNSTPPCLDAVPTHCHVASSSDSQKLLIGPRGDFVGNQEGEGARMHVKPMSLSLPLSAVAPFL